MGKRGHTYTPGCGAAVRGAVHGSRPLTLPISVCLRSPPCPVRTAGRAPRGTGRAGPGAGDPRRGGDEPPPSLRPSLPPSFSSARRGGVGEESWAAAGKFRSMAERPGPAGPRHCGGAAAGERPRWARPRRGEAARPLPAPPAGRHGPLDPHQAGEVRGRWVPARTPPAPCAPSPPLLPSGRPASPPREPPLPPRIGVRRSAALRRRCRVYPRRTFACFPLPRLESFLFFCTALAPFSSTHFPNSCLFFQPVLSFPLRSRQCVFTLWTLRAGGGGVCPVHTRGAPGFWNPASSGLTFVILPLQHVLRWRVL